jgi:hypothetical protein
MALAMTDRKKTGVAFWATVVVVVMLPSYPLSLGPVIWAANRGWLPEWTQQSLLCLYWPLIFLHENGPQPVVKLMDLYGDVWGSL